MERQGRGILSVVATPIGNLDDLSPRAARALRDADVIACEDTRMARKLLSRVEGRSHARLVRFDARAERTRSDELVRAVAQGNRVVLTTDAGTPGISDPGQRLVAGCRAAGLKVEVVPGPSAATAALVASGLPTARFSFEGFLPRTGAARRRRLESIAGDDRTVVLFEAPHRLAASLEAMADVLGPRRAAICRELTKIHEEVVRGTLPELAARVREAGVRGEITIVVEGAREAATEAATDDELAGAVEDLVAGGSSRRDAIARVSAERGVPKRAVYRAATGKRVDGA